MARQTNQGNLDMKDKVFTKEGSTDKNAHHIGSFRYDIFKYIFVTFLRTNGVLLF